MNTNWINLNNSFEWLDSWYIKIENIVKSVLYRFLFKMPELNKRNITFLDDYEWFSNEDLLKELIDVMLKISGDKFEDLLFMISDIFKKCWMEKMSKNFLQQDYSARELFEDMCFLLAEDFSKFNYIGLVVIDYRDDIDYKLK